MKKLCILSILLISGFGALGQTKHTVNIRDNRFDPSTITINVGDIVEWVNLGTMIHTATSGSNCQPSGPFNSGNLNPNATFSFTFTTAGAVSYFCIPHCGEMAGIITVQASTSVKELDQDDFSVYPNPATDLVNLSLNLKAPGEVTLRAYDFTGKEVTEELTLQPAGSEGQNMGFDVSNWATGIYILRVSVGGKYAFSHKLVRQ